MKFEWPQTDAAFSRVWDLLKQSRSPVFHAIGNHDLYNFKPAKLRTQFNEDDGAQVTSTLHSHHVCDNTALISCATLQHRTTLLVVRYHEGNNCNFDLRSCVDVFWLC